MDTLSTVERLRFSDKSLALDSAVDGHAGQVAQIIRGLFGSSYANNPAFVGCWPARSP